MSVVVKLIILTILSYLSFGAVLMAEKVALITDNCVEISVKRVFFQLSVMNISVIKIFMNLQSYDPF